MTFPPIPQSLCAIVLAAGRSVRMGTQKLLLPLRGSTVIGCAVDAVLISGVQRILVVVGVEADPIVSALRGRPVEFVQNPGRESDMLGSVRCGLRVLPADCGEFLLVLGDQPRFPDDLVHRLVRKRAETGCGLVVPVQNGRRGHPVLVAIRHREALLSGFENEGVRGLFRSAGEDVAEVACDETSILEDLDTPTDYDQATLR